MDAALIHSPLMCLSPTNICKNYKKVLLNGNFFSSAASSFRCRCIKNENSSESLEGFSVLRKDIHADTGSVWSSMGFYMFSLHIPLSYGGLSAAAKILHQPVLNPQMEAFLVLGIQSLELGIVLLLLQYPGKPQYDLQDFFCSDETRKQRSWLLASVLGFGFLLSLIFITSYIADGLMGPKDVNNPFLKEILSSGSSSVTACILVYCIITPLLEEVVYRGFLLTSLASKMKWHQAVTVSSIVFSAAHLSALLTSSTSALLLNEKRLRTNARCRYKMVSSNIVLQSHLNSICKTLGRLGRSKKWERNRKQVIDVGYVLRSHRSQTLYRTSDT